MLESQNNLRYKIIIEYLGAGYSGWQRQNNFLTVQGVIENAIKQFTHQDILICASGRTDAGVNAIGQVAHFDLPHAYDPYKLTGSLNYFLRQHTIGILHTEIVNNDFHARFSAKRRHYAYKILNRKAIPVIEANLKTWIRHDLDCKNMQIAANYLLGYHDFTSFRSSICQSSSPMKTLDHIKVQRFGDNIEIHVSALSFLHHMVRNIVGSLIFVGSGKWPPEKIIEVLQARNRHLCGPTAEAKGLYFLRVDY